MNARDRILGRLRSANAAPHLLPTFTADEVPADERIGRLTVQLQAAHAEVVDAREGDWRDAVATVCRDHDIRRLALAQSVPGLALEKSAVATRHFVDIGRTELFAETDAGLTVADCALAATGMLVLASSPAQPRTLSLVPPVHICLVDAGRIHAGLDAALAAEGWAKAMPTNLIFISGPSKTADIQQTLAYGAHGPKQLIVILAAPGSLT
jgi:L-lactate dehydrogenase complex protein LldG